MTPFGAVGRSGIQAYSARSGKTADEFRQGMGEVLTPEVAGSAVVELVLRDPGSLAPSYLLGAGGLRDVPTPA